MTREEQIKLIVSAEERMRDYARKLDADEEYQRVIKECIAPDDGDGWRAAKVICC